MLFNVVNSNVDVQNFVSTLIWRCPTSRRHINLRATLKQRWNICWVPLEESATASTIEDEQDISQLKSKKTLKRENSSNSLEAFINAKKEIFLWILDIPTVTSMAESDNCSWCTWTIRNYFFRSPFVTYLDACST